MEKDVQTAASQTSLATNSKPKGHPKADILPHSKELEKEYYIGDIYHRFNHRKDGNPYPFPSSPKTLSSSSFSNKSTRSLGKYFDHVKWLSAEWLDLGYLAQWMEVTTHPTKLECLHKIDQDERASRTHVMVLNFDDKYKSTRKEYKTIEKLKEDFTNGPNDTNDRVNARLIIVEDLSRDVIETLGARFDIDPLFFRQQISDYTWYNNRDPWVEVSELDLVSSERNFFHISYVQSRYLQNPEQLKDGRKEAGHFNVLRRLDTSNSHTPDLEIEGSDVALVRSGLSLWARSNKGSEEGWLGILLVDPPIKAGYPLWGGYRSFSAQPSMHDQPGTKFPGPPRTSTLDDLTYWLTDALTKREMEIFQHRPHGFPKLIVRKIFQIVCSEWLLMMDHVKARIALIEWELQRADFIPESEEGLHNSLKKLFPWRRILPFYYEAATDAFDLIIRRHTFLGMPTSELQELTPDFEIIRHKFQTIVNHSEKVLAAASAIISIEESKKATSQNKGVSRLTYIALTFAPLSFLSSFFSMTENISALGKTIWIYVVVAIPLTIILLMIASLSKYIGRAKKKCKKWWKERNEQKAKVKNEKV